MYADVTLELERHPNALQVPTTAVGRTATDAASSSSCGTARSTKVPVTTGISAADASRSPSGLAGDETVVKNLDPDARARARRVSAVERATADRARGSRLKVAAPSRLASHDSPGRCVMLACLCTTARPRGGRGPIAPGAELTLERAIGIALQHHPPGWRPSRGRAAEERIGEAARRSCRRCSASRSTCAPPTTASATPLPRRAGPAAVPDQRPPRQPAHRHVRQLRRRRLGLPVSLRLRPHARPDRSAPRRGRRRAGAARSWSSSTRLPGDEGLLRSPGGEGRSSRSTRRRSRSGPSICTRPR